MARRKSHKKSIRAKCLKTCPRAIRIKCKPLVKNGVTMGKVCAVNVPGLVKKKGLTGEQAGKMIGAIKRQLHAKNCGEVKVHSN